ncbi:hypothetical protein BGZ83_005729 [Gryganskiella cystojenkinii]|nr:hypothetical protein BGZ83_005729 [Gryganskiella cystojenkinii]
MTFGTNNNLKDPLLPLQLPSPSSPSSLNRPHSNPMTTSRPFSLKFTTLVLLAISSALLIINNGHLKLISSSDSLDNTSPSSPSSSSAHAGSHLHPLPHPPYEGPPVTTDDEFYSPYVEPEDDEGMPEDDDEGYSIIDNGSAEDDLSEEGLEEDNSDNSTSSTPAATPVHPSRVGSPKLIQAQQDIPAAHCPGAFLTTDTSFDPPSYASSSSIPIASSPYATPSKISSQALRSDNVHCRSVPSQLQDYSVALCISNEDCSTGFIQVIHQNPSPTLVRTKVSKNATHDRYFRQVAGPDDFYVLIEGAQKLALSAHLVSRDLMIKTTPVSDAEDHAAVPPVNDDEPLLVYRADFRMTLPGPVRLSVWLTYQQFRATQENRPGTWPQWTHEVLVDGTVTPSLTICPECEMTSFLDRLRSTRENEFEQCDRMAPVRGAYWQENLALKVYSELDLINRAPGAGVDPAHPAKVDPKNENAPMLTRGWRFVPSGCTMTSTTKVPNASSQDPFWPTCDSMTSPPSEMREHDDGDDDEESEEDSTDDVFVSSAPRRRVLFTGDSQVRTTYNAILNHYRPIDPAHQKFGAHDEYLPGLETLDWNHTIRSKTSSAARKVPHVKTDTEIELIYRADQFLDLLVASTDSELDKFDTIYVNLGQWPASGPVAGGQWDTEQLTDRWEQVLTRLQRWKESRQAQALVFASLTSEAERANNPIYGAAENGGSRVIWAGMNAFPMRKDPNIKVKGDWRTNARLGYWDDWIESISQRDGSWFRRMNAWQLTFPILDQITDKAHFQETDAIDALKVEALYKLDLCSRVHADPEYTSVALPTTPPTSPS